jgi:D-serine dehydratase
MPADIDGVEVLPDDRLALLRQRVRELGSEILDSRIKGLGLESGESLPAAEVGARRWNVLEGHLDHPALVLKESAVANNVEVMANYCRDHHVELAPHGKTTMSPELFLRQLEAGAWAITAATAWQVRFMRSLGVPRILLANELVDPAAIGWVLDELDAAASGSAPELDFLCYVDSEAGISIIEDVVAARGSDTRLPVLVELGYANGRSGCRTVVEAVALAERAAASPGVRLCGVSAFEGLMPAGSLEETLTAVKTYMNDVHELVDAVALAGLGEEAPLVITSGGSAYFDIVTDTLGPGAFDFPVVTVLRSGCYVTHDEEMYELTSQLGGRPGTGLGLLEPALELWATVWSRPSPELAIVGFGKRDCPYDYLLPVPLRTRRPGASTWVDVQDVFEVVDLNDQHAFVRVPADSALAVGDEVVVGISHPCGAFDKWSYIPVVDEDYVVIDGIFTFF